MLTISWSRCPHYLEDGHLHLSSRWREVTAVGLGQGVAVPGMRKTTLMFFNTALMKSLIAPSGHRRGRAVTGRGSAFAGMIRLQGETGRGGVGVSVE